MDKAVWNIDGQSGNTAVDLSNCDREPIHIPGFIQPRGRLLVAGEDGVLTHVCEHALATLNGRTHLADWLGKEAFGELRFEEIAQDRPHFYNAVETGALACLPGSWAISAHRYDGRCIVELERVAPSGEIDNLAAWLQGAVAEISRASAVEDMMLGLARSVREISGFDRTMVYRFDADWHGEVIAESRGDLDSSYLGLHFPSSDIPAQARALYTRQILRTIEDVNYTPIAIVPLSDQSSPPIDLSYCGLRSVSPVHIEYLQNMGVTASLVVSLLHGDRLWGLLVCHHYSGHACVTPRLRAIVQSVSYFASGQVSRLEELEVAKLRAAAFSSGTAFDLQDLTERRFFQSVAEAYPSWQTIFNIQALVAQSPRNRTVMGAVGKASGNEVMLPPDMLLSERLPLATLEAAGCGPDIVGGALITLDESGAFVLLGRADERKVVNWAGNPDKSAFAALDGERHLHPRRSFEVWQQETQGRSKPWSRAEIEGLVIVAGRLRTGYALALRRSAEKQLARSQRLSALGELTGGIAHDFNNLLSVIIGDLELVMEDDNGAVNRSLVKTALDAADRASNLTSHLLSFARRQALQPRAVSVADLVAQTIVLLRRTLDVKYSLDSDVSPVVSRARADPTLLESAILNLVLNARDAMVAGGSIVVSAADRFVADTLAKTLLVPSGQYVVIAVQDSGTGIPHAIRDRVFEPFFSTKLMGHGTGLGLSMVFGFAKQSGGAIEIGDAPGGGAVVRIYLPIAKETPALQTAAIGEAELPKGGGHILLVEDKEDVGAALALHLRALGFSPQRVLNAEDALTLFLDPESDFDLVVSDIGLPGMGGVELARQLRQKNPALPILLITGFATEAQVAELNGDKSGLVLLRKPFRRRELAAALSKCIGLK